MHTNLGRIDMAARFALAAILLIFGIFFSSNGFVDLVAYLIAAVAITTGLMGYCPLYRAIGFDTSNG